MKKDIDFVVKIKNRSQSAISIEPMFRFDVYGILEIENIENDTAYHLNSGPRRKLASLYIERPKQPNVIPGCPDPLSGELVDAILEEEGFRGVILNAETDRHAGPGRGFGIPLKSYLDVNIRTVYYSPKTKEIIPTTESCYGWIVFCDISDYLYDLFEYKRNCKGETFEADLY